MATNRTTRLKKEAFIRAYRELASITGAADAIGMPRGRHYEWMHQDEWYVAEFAAAEEAVVDMLEQEAVRRAVRGNERPVYQGGKHVGSIREYSDTLLIFLLKGRRPEMYRERSHVVLEQKDDSDLDQSIARLMEEMATRATDAAAPLEPL